MIFISLTSFFALLVGFGLLLAIFFLQYHGKQIKDKSSPFECGFSLVKATRVPFSTRYFLLTVIFLVFDIELVLLFPLMNFASNLSLFFFIFSIIIFFILLLGVIIEWKEGALNWMT
uniref:NADH-ubiquinone oxidoreductase chain 3 n=1 Tax=Falcidens acutargatus TaxID=2079778 RepID=A0A343X870_9MOLL|nr:NADH dehydrogenase subunit 3 [Falcidens acutargatus]AWH02129.1 NADH dehydrogenase subunit 3 [Falcidens acutargatus]